MLFASSASRSQSLQAWQGEQWAKRACRSTSAEAISLTTTVTRYFELRCLWRRAACSSLSYGALAPVSYFVTFLDSHSSKVSRTLDFGFADFAVSKAFDRLASLLPESDSLLATAETKGRESYENRSRYISGPTVHAAVVASPVKLNLSCDIKASTQIWLYSYTCRRTDSCCSSLHLLLTSSPSLSSARRVKLSADSKTLAARSKRAQTSETAVLILYLPLTAFLSDLSVELSFDLSFLLY